MKVLFIKLLFGLLLGLVRSDFSCEEIKQAIDKVIVLNGSPNGNNLKEMKIVKKELEHYKVALDSIQSARKNSISLKPLFPGGINNDKPLSLEEKIKDSKSPKFYFEKNYLGSGVDESENFYITVSVKLAGGFVYENYVHIYKAKYELKGILLNKKPAIKHRCRVIDISNDRLYDERPFSERRKTIHEGIDTINHCSVKCLMKLVDGIDSRTAECCCPYEDPKGREQTPKEKEHSGDILADFGSKRIKDLLLGPIRNDFPSLFKDEDEDDEEEDYF